MRYLALSALAALMFIVGCRRHNDYYCTCFHGADTMTAKTILGKTSDMSAQFADSSCIHQRPTDSCVVTVALSPAE